MSWNSGNSDFCGAPCLALDLGRGDVMILPVLLLRRRRLEINGAGSEIIPPPSLPLTPSLPIPSRGTLNRHVFGPIPLSYYCSWRLFQP